MRVIVLSNVRTHLIEIPLYTCTLKAVVFPFQNTGVIKFPYSTRDHMSCIKNCSVSQK